MTQNLVRDRPRRELIGHRCGGCGEMVYPVVFERTGLRGHIERHVRGGNLALMQRLPGMEAGGAAARGAHVGAVVDAGAHLPGGDRARLRGRARA